MTYSSLLGGVRRLAKLGSVIFRIVYLESSICVLVNFCQPYLQNYLLHLQEYNNDNTVVF